MTGQNFFQAAAQWLNQNGLCAGATPKGDLLSQAAVIGTIIGVIVGCIQLVLGMLKQSRENKIDRAKFGYGLIDAIFTDNFVLKLLEGVDASPSNINDVREALGPSVSNFNEELQGIRNRIDWLLLYFDRVEHALSADLTTFEVIRMPLGYYVAILAKVKREILGYTKHIGYDRVLHFLDRFESWRDKA
jgi:hypothetical protein